MADLTKTLRTTNNAIEKALTSVRVPKKKSSSKSITSSSSRKNPIKNSSA